MTHLRLSTLPGSPHRPNEDYVGATVGITTNLVLLDGAGGPAELPSGCKHGTPWYVQQLGSHALHLMTETAMPLPAVLADAINTVAAMHEHTCDLADPASPASTVVMARLADGFCEYLVLGDSTLLVQHAEGAITAVSDTRLDHVAPHLFAEMARLPTGTPEHQQARIRYVDYQRSRRNTDGGYWIAANDPNAADRALTGTIRHYQQVALLSDGATRYVEFELGTWPDLLGALNAHGPDGLIDTVRTAEESDPHGDRWPRAKASDDISAIWAHA